MKSFAFLSPGVTRLHAQAGTAVYDCIREGAAYAMTENINVVVVHNGREYLIEPQKILKGIGEANLCDVPAPMTAVPENPNDL